MQKLIITTEEDLTIIIEMAIRKAIGEKSTINPPPEVDTFLNIEEACKYLRMAKQTMYQFTSTNTIPHFKKGKRLLFSKLALTKWIMNE